MATVYHGSTPSHGDLWDEYDPSVDREQVVTASCNHCPWSTTVRESEVDDDTTVYREAAWRAARHEESVGKHTVADFGVSFEER